MDNTDIFLKVFLAALLVALFAWTVRSAQAHKWYPRECCHGKDCGELVSTRKENGLTIYRNKQGLEGTRNYSTSERVSPDMKEHVCIVGKTVICHFKPKALY